ncbi:MAG: MATE family efflux transporter [Ruminococcaceae bacterium]|nr:MATE family efflux transporter [Oscillospiraceae bacterium]
MKIQLSEHFTYHKLLRFVFPSIVMMIFTSIYGVVDGLFVSNFAGKTPFAAINLIMPLLIILGALGFMVGAGGTAIVAKTLGEGDKEKANRYFSMLVYTVAIGGTVLALLGILLARPAAMMLGAEGKMLDYCVKYARIVLIALPFFMLQNVFQSFFIAAEKPNLGLYVTVAAGVTNIVLDALFVGLFRWGLEGAAAATAVSQFVGGVLPILYFARPNDSLLKLGKTEFYPAVLFKTVTNGSSELMSNISSSIVTVLYNHQLMEYAGEDGLAAYGAIMYVAFTFVAIFIGYAVGSAPIISFHFGAKNHAELKNLLKKSLVLLSVCGVCMMLLGFALSHPLAKLFVGYDKALMEMTKRGFIIYSLHFLICGINIYGSSLFTALNNGGISAAIAFLRTLVFQSASVMLLPLLFELDGVWFSVLVAEVLALVTTLFFIVYKRKEYRYF